MKDTMYEVSPEPYPNPTPAWCPWVGRSPPVYPGTVHTSTRLCAGGVEVDEASLFHLRSPLQRTSREGKDPSNDSAADLPRASTFSSPNDRQPRRQDTDTDSPRRQDTGTDSPLYLVGYAAVPQHVLIKFVLELLVARNLFESRVGCCGSCKRYPRLKLRTLTQQRAQFVLALIPATRC